MPTKGTCKYADKIPFMIDCYNRGLGTVEIAKLLGVSRSNIMRILREKGVDIRKTGNPKGTVRRKRNI